MFATATTKPRTNARNATWRIDTGEDWIGEVDQLPAGAREITAEEYAQRLADIQAHNKAAAADEPPPDLAPTANELIAAELETVADDPALASASRAALTRAVGLLRRQA